MPAFKQETVLGIARGIKVYLNLEVGATRGETAPAWRYRDTARALGNVRRRLMHRVRELTHVSGKPRRLGPTVGVSPNGNAKGARQLIQPENIIWVFCTSRSGSTWMAQMMEDMPKHEVWHEPLVGMLFGNFFFQQKPDRKGHHYVLGGEKDTWLRPLRNFVLDVASSKFPKTARRGGYLGVKEPAGAVGAPLISQALPESNLLLLVRDPRDVASSALDANREGSWFRGRERKDGAKKFKVSSKNEDALVEKNARSYMIQMERGQQAYEEHKGPKILVRYEELRADTPGTMKRIYAAFGIPIDEAEIERVANAHSWDNIPEEEKGPGKFYRKGTPGGWREDLTPKQAAKVEKITAPLLEAFYSEAAPDASH